MRWHSSKMWFVVENRLNGHCHYPWQIQLRHDSSLQWSFFCFSCCFLPTGVYSNYTIDVYSYMDYCYSTGSENSGIFFFSNVTCNLFESSPLDWWKYETLSIYVMLISLVFYLAYSNLQHMINGSVTKYNICSSYFNSNEFATSFTGIIVFQKMLF